MTRRLLPLLAAGVAVGWLAGRAVVELVELRGQVVAARRVWPTPRRTGLMPPFDQDGGR